MGSLVSDARSVRLTPRPPPCRRMAIDDRSVYREFPPPVAVAGPVLCVWEQRVTPCGAPYRHPVLPDGCTDVVCIDDAPPVVAGPATRDLCVSLRAGARVVGVRLRPGWAAAVLGVPASDLRDVHVAFTDLHRSARPGAGRPPTVWADACVDARSVAPGLGRPNPLVEPRPQHTPRHLGRLVAHLRPWLTRVPAPDALVLAALRALARDPSRPVAGMAAALGVSSRHLHRCFCATVGYGPRTFQRVLRLQRLLAAASGGAARRSLAALAADVGYADQAHLCRDVRALAGHAPRDLVGRRVSTLAMSDLIKNEGRRPGRVEPTSPSPLWISS